MTDETLSEFLRSVAGQCDRAFDGSGIIGGRALATASAALRMVAAAPGWMRVVAAAPEWEPGIKSPRIVPPATSPREYGRVSVSAEMYDHIKRLARRWANFSDAGRAGAAGVGPGPWLETDLTLLARAMGYHLNPSAMQHNDHGGVTEAQLARRAHAAHVIERAWAAANDQQRDQILGASPPLVHALKMLEANPADEPAVDNANADDDDTTIDKAIAVSASWWDLGSLTRGDIRNWAPTLARRLDVLRASLVD
jgi:hypothetical protein